MIRDAVKNNKDYRNKKQEKGKIVSQEFNLEQFSKEQEYS